MEKDMEQHFIEFLNEVISTNSPASRLNALYELLRKEPHLISTEAQNNVINSFKQNKDAKSKAGLTDIQKRWSKKKEAVKDRNWLFYPKSKRGTICKSCFSRYELSDPCILNTDNGNGYHPNCAPEEAVKEFVDVNDTFYKNYLKSLKV